MKDLNSVKSLVFGLDLGDRSIQVCVLEADDGKIVKEFQISTTQLALQSRFGKITRARIALETGTHSPWISRLLEEMGHEVIVANPRRVKLISTNRTKDDRTDAWFLAELARVSPALLSPIRHRGAQAQAHLAMLRSRDALVSTRTRLVNHCRGAVKSWGCRLSASSTAYFASKVASQIPPELSAALEPMLETIQELSGRLRALNKALQRLAQEHYPETELLQQIRGVGPTTSLAFVLVLEQHQRFTRSRHVGAYLGLTPGRRASGKSNPQQRITKQGDRLMRKLLVQCARYILGPFGEDCDLRRFGETLARRGGPGAKKRAAVAVARKLAVLLHSLWRSGEVYDPLRNAQALAA